MTLDKQLAQAKYALQLADEDRAGAMKLVRLAVFAADQQKMPRKQIAAKLGVTRQTVYTILKTL